MDRIILWCAILVLPAVRAFVYQCPAPRSVLLSMAGSPSGIEHTNAKNCGQSITATVRYLSSAAAPSVIQNRKCYTKRGLDGSDDTFVGCDADLRQVQVADARALLGTEQHPTLAKEGFELRSDFIVKLHSDEVDREQVEASNARGQDLDFLDHDSVVRLYYPQVASFIKRATGAREVFPFDHNVRRTASASVKGSSIQVQPPLGLNYGVHTDYTVTSGARRMMLLTEPPKLNDALRAHVEAEGRESVIPREMLAPSASAGTPCDKDENASSDAAPRRMVMFNVWRSISQSSAVKQMPLAMCAADSVDWNSDLVVFEIHYADRIGENFLSRFNAKHRWFYFPSMTFDECLLFKQWDSWGSVNLQALDGLQQHLQSADDDAGAALGLSHLTSEERAAILQDVKNVLARSARFNSPRAASKDGEERAKIGGEGSATFCLHSAIEQPCSPEEARQAPPRESIEVRCFAFF